jgi:mannose-6-phosphate isomerase-like protein (cupin superfamily)
MQDDAAATEDMPATDDARHRVVILGDGQGQAYPCGSMHAVFKADGAATADAYSVSEWTLDPGSGGVHAHVHEANDDVFYVLAGTPTFEVDGVESVVGPGTFLRVPPGVSHAYRNDSAEPVQLLNLYVPGGFEAEMPQIAAWYAEHPD